MTTREKELSTYKTAVLQIVTFIAVTGGVAALVLGINKLRGED